MPNPDGSGDSDLEGMSAAELRAIVARERRRSPTLRDAIERAKLSKHPVALSHQLEAELKRSLASLDAGLHWRNATGIVNVFYDWLDSVRRPLKAVRYKTPLA